MLARDMLRAIAPAKINLNLHITGKREDGYHLLQSLVAFTDFGDLITIKRADEMRLDITGPFANLFNANECSADRCSRNLLIQALYNILDHFGSESTYHIILEKNLPLASGIGGGTSDAATLARLILQAEDRAMNNNLMIKLTQVIGADFPCCFEARPLMMNGIGENITSLSSFPKTAIMLINSGIACDTKAIFKQLKSPFAKEQNWPTGFENRHDLITFLNTTENDLRAPAQNLHPIISEILEAISAQDDCVYNGMSGSGATCFGLFENIKHAEEAASEIKKHRPNWWVQSGVLSLHPDE